MSKAENKNLEPMRHSLAHIMAAAMQKLWPEVKFGIGPTTEEGFYYDVSLGEQTISPDDLPKIESEMHKIIEADVPFEQFVLAINEAIKKEKASNQIYKVELLEELKEQGEEEVSYYRSGEFEDLCHGPHIKSSGKVGSFKLYKVAGAYWRGDETRPMMQRVYGAAFTSQEALDVFFAHLEKAQENDHRKLGQELDLFTFSDLVGSGLPLFTPRGTWLRELLGRYAQQLRAEKGFERVWVPHITKTDLYKTSGHWEKFGDEQFLVSSQETSDELALKPMNCPHHTQIYASKQRSYRDLPVRYMENTTIYRDEKSGELHGISRVRSATQDDSHVFCTPEQIEAEVVKFIDAAKVLYRELQLELKFRLSFRDESAAWLGDEELWQKAQQILENLAKKEKLDYFVEEGEAAFYGPKIDFMATDALGREQQLATVQLDFVQPSRFSLEYIDENSTAQTPVMIHAALLGSIERFLSVYIEHTGGRFPFWLAPEQVRILTINDDSLKYAQKVADVLSATIIEAPLRHNEIRFSVDDRNESLGKKIRAAEVQKIPVIAVVGPKDEAAEIVSLRTEGTEEKVKLKELTEWLKAQK
ncbi:MAG: threonine--tRNA ligase [Candidatus Saccharimonadales bacterium]